MGMGKTICVGVCLAVALAAARPAHAQGCSSSQDAAVQCFVGNAVRTNLLRVHYGMTLSQFKAYGVAVSKILQTQPTYMVSLGMASAVADAMPATNANGSTNQGAQDLAVTQIVQAEVSNGLVVVPAESNTQDLIWFSLDLVTATTDQQGLRLSPGMLLRIVDSYVVAATANGIVNWALVDAGLSGAVDNLASAGLLKLPSTITVSQLKSFVNTLAQIIYNYRVATGRPAL
jgi:hypothetical protein